MRCMWPCLLRAGAALCMLMALSCRQGWSGELRFGVHPGFDRLVAPLPEEAPYTSKMQAGRLIIESNALDNAPAVAVAGQRIRGVLSGRGVLSFSVLPLSRTRIWRSGDRLVIDVFEPAGRPPVAASRAGTPHIEASSPLSRPKTAPALDAQVKNSAPVLASPPKLTPGPHFVPGAAAAVSDTKNSAVPQPAPPAGTLHPAPSPAPAPVSASIQFQAADDDFPHGSLLVLASQEVGAASFARNGVAHVVFDAALPIDLGVLKDDPAYGATTAEPLPSASHLLLKPPEGLRVSLRRQKEGWRFGFSKQDQKQDPITMSRKGGGLLFEAPSAGSTLVIDDRETGATLLIGTQRKGEAHVAAARRTPEFLLPATSLGVVVDTLSDRLELLGRVDGFMLRTGSGQAVATAWPGPVEAAASEAAGLTRRFDFPDLPVPMLRNRLHDAMRDEATAPARGRHDARLRTAQAMLALGLDVEALAVLRAAAADDPASDMQDGPALRAMAAGLAARPELPGSADMIPPASPLGATDEEAFWRAVLHAPALDTSQDAATLATDWKLALIYPEPLRRVLLPRVADRLLRGGQIEAAAELVKASASPDLDLARAGLARVAGHPDEALAGFDRVAAGANRDQAARARREAVELRFAEHRLSPQDAAKALQSQVFAWRGDDRELELRLRIAALLQQAGDWRTALGALRDAEHLYPEAQDRLHEAQAALVRDLLKQNAAATMPPLELVAFVGECADLLAGSAAGAALAPILIDKLLALDLPERAEPILRRMIQASAASAPKAELGLKLAELLLAKGDAPGAAAALDTTEAADLAPDCANRRNLFKARLLTSIGDKDGALRLLDASNAPDALEQKAALLEQLHAWNGADDVLVRLIGQRVIGTGMLSGAEADLVLRYAGDAAQAGDMAALRKLRDDYSARIPAGGQADLLRVLTQPPVRAVDDLPRASQELAAARALPASFASSQTR